MLALSRLRWLRSLFAKKPNNPIRQRRRSRPIQLYLEAFEDRITPTTIVVDAADSDDLIRVLDAGGGKTTVQSDNFSPTFTSVTFNNAGVTSLEIHTHKGKDTLTIDSLAGSFTAPITVTGDGDIVLGNIQ